MCCGSGRFEDVAVKRRDRRLNESCMIAVMLSN
jgi:hypothetical protein